MKKEMDILTYAQILEIHAYYKQNQSLEQTASWVREKYGLTVSRHDLSWKFKSLDLEVRPPNGREVTHWRDLNTYKSPFGRVAADMVQLAVSDFFAYQSGGSKMDWMSACAFMAGELWQSCIGTLLYGAENISLGPNVLPQGISTETILEGATLYNRGYGYWVLGQE